MDWRILHFTENYIFLKYLFVLWKAAIVGAAVIAALISFLKCQDNVSSQLKYLLVAQDCCASP